jgi:hypothetical protein
MALGTLSFAIPVTVVFGIEMHRRGALSFPSAVLVFAISLGFGAIAALGFWNTWRGCRPKLTASQGGIAQGNGACSLQLRGPGNVLVAKPPQDTRRHHARRSQPGLRL